MNNAEATKPPDSTDEPTGKVKYELNNRHGEVLTQFPFELRVTMPKPNSGRGYSNTYIEEINKELRQTKSTDE